MKAQAVDSTTHDKKSVRETFKKFVSHAQNNHENCPDPTICGRNRPIFNFEKGKELKKMV